MNEKNDSEKALREAGLRATSPRKAILSYLQKSAYPLSIKKMQGKFPRIDQVTLYRMMETFSKVGIVTRIELGQGRASFEVKHDDHHHIVCIECDRVEDFTDTSHERVQRNILSHSRSFAKIVNHSFELFGLCNVCIKNKSIPA